MDKIFKTLKGDKVLWVIVLLLWLISLVSVYSFVPILVKTEGGTPLSYLFKHFVYIIIGFGLMKWIHTKDPKYIEKLSKFMFYLAIALLIFTFFFGVRVNDASRWVRIPFVGLTFQSSDFAKFALVVFISRRLVVKNDKPGFWNSDFARMTFPILLMTALIAKDNFSTAGLLFGVALLLLFIAQYPFKKILSVIGVGLAGAGSVVLLHLVLPSLNLLPRFDTWMNRFFRAYSDDHAVTVDNMQAINAKLAIYNGGYTGVGVGQGELKHYTPEAYADFFYSSFVEEFGLVLSIGLIMLYMIMFYRILKIALNAKNPFDTYVSIGVGVVFLSQALVNMFVCTGLMPVTGQIMPFLAMGGSAMVMSSLALGVVQSIAHKNGIGEETVSSN
ncbi:MAG TPA: FtsW/RodA/SpoVE family cell cycle protein [Brumimicrobium sp.]|nr:FtsW/RodA/SpoVE family cell cycle protein [Brumimicrobium sp.]